MSVSLQTGLAGLQQSLAEMILAQPKPKESSVGNNTNEDSNFTLTPPKPFALNKEALGATNKDFNTELSTGTPLIENGFDPEHIWDTITDSPLLMILTGAAIVSAISIGSNDFANALGTAVGSGVLRMKTAQYLGGAAAFLGAVFFGKETASTVKKGIWSPDETSLDRDEILAALSSAVIAAGAWVMWCTSKGLAVSTTHSIIGGLIGVGIVADYKKTKNSDDIGNGIKGPVIAKVVASWGASPVLGGLAAAGIYSMLNRLPISNKPFVYLQVLTCVGVAMGIGMNDIANAIGPWAAGYDAIENDGNELSKKASIPLWMQMVGGAAIFFGVRTFGSAVTKTIGHEIIPGLTAKMGFSAELATVGTVWLASKMGIPVSTTHTLIGAMYGISVAHIAKPSNWALMRSMGGAWVLSLPVAALLAGGTYVVIHDTFIAERTTPSKPDHELFPVAESGKWLARGGRWFDIIRKLSGRSFSSFQLASLLIGGGYAIAYGVEQKDPADGITEGLLYYMSAAPFGGLVDIANGVTGLKHGENVNHVARSEKESWYSLITGAASLALDYIVARIAIRRALRLQRIPIAQTRGPLNAINNWIRSLLKSRGMNTTLTDISISAAQKNALIVESITSKVTESTKGLIKQSLADRLPAEAKAAADALRKLGSNAGGEEIARAVEKLGRKSSFSIKFLELLMRKTIIPNAIKAAVQESTRTSDLNEWAKAGREFAVKRIASMNAHPILWSLYYVPKALLSVPRMVFGLFGNVAKIAAKSMAPYTQYMRYNLYKYFDIGRLTSRLATNARRLGFRLPETEPKTKPITISSAQGLMPNYNFENVSVKLPVEVAKAAQRFGITPETAYMILADVFEFESKLNGKNGPKARGVRAVLAEKMDVDYKAVAEKLQSRIDRELTPEALDKYLKSEQGRKLSSRIYKTTAVPNLGGAAAGLLAWMNADTISDIIGLDPVYDREERFMVAISLAMGTASTASGMLEVLTNAALKKSYHYVTTSIVGKGAETALQFTYHSRANLHRAMVAAIFKNWNLTGSGARLLLSGTRAVATLPIKFFAGAGPAVLSYRTADGIAKSLGASDDLRKWIGGGAIIAPMALNYATKGGAAKLASKIPGLGLAASVAGAGFAIDCGTALVRRLSLGDDTPYFNYLNMVASELKDDEQGTNSLDWWDLAVIPLVFKGIDWGLEVITPEAAALADSYDDWGFSKNKHWQRLYKEDEERSVEAQKVLREAIKTRLIHGFSGDKLTEDYYKQIDIQRLFSTGFNFGITKQIERITIETMLTKASSVDEIHKKLININSEITKEEVLTMIDEINNRSMKKALEELYFIAQPVNSEIRKFADRKGRLNPARLEDFARFVFDDDSIDLEDAGKAIVIARRRMLGEKIMFGNATDREIEIAQNVGIINRDNSFSDGLAYLQSLISMTVN